MLTITPLSPTLTPPTSTPQPDRTAGGVHLHPSAHDRTDALGPEALLDIAEGLGRVQQPLAARPWNDPDAPRSVRLLATAAYDVWLITWPPGSLMGAHDHGPVRSVVHVVDGELQETVARRERAVGGEVRVLRAGDSSSLGESGLHSLANRSDHDVTTVHAYSPPLSMMSFIDGDNPRDSSLHRRETVGSRRPVASSGDYAERGRYGGRRG